MKFKEALNEGPVSTGDVQGIQAPMKDKDKKKKIVRRPIKVKKVKI